jgi:hypothetical protein
MSSTTTDNSSRITAIAAMKQSIRHFDTNMTALAAYDELLSSLVLHDAHTMQHTPMPNAHVDVAVCARTATRTVT